MAPDGKRKQVWRYSSRAECQRCHNKWSGSALGFIAPQLNRVQEYDGATAWQLETLAHIKIFEKPIPLEKRERLANPHDPAEDLDGRARAYLQTNCAHCHRHHAGGAVLSKMHYDIPLDQTNMVGARPTQGTFGIHSAQVIAPGDPYRSVLLYRMAKLGGGRMPHIGSTEVDQAGVELIFQWLQQMPAAADQEIASVEAATKRRKQELAELASMRETKDASVQIEIADRLLTSPCGALLLLRSIDHRELESTTASMVIQKAVSIHERN